MFGNTLHAAARALQHSAYFHTAFHRPIIEFHGTNIFVIAVALEQLFIDKMNLYERWNEIKKPFAAVVAVVIGALCTIVARDRNFVTVDPGSIVFVTILLVDMGSAQSFYVTVVFRIIGTVLGLLLGAGVSFNTNQMVKDGVSSVGISAFQLSALGVILFIPLMVNIKYPKYSYVSVIFIFTVTSLIFSGLTNPTTVATLAALGGGILIGIIIMWLFRFDSAEALLLADHRVLLSHILTMIKISVRANPHYRDEYFKILEDSKTSFTSNQTSIADYNRWMRWTHRKTPFDFTALTNGLRALYHQTASLFWSLCRDKVIPASSETDPIHLYCSSPGVYFDLYHDTVVNIVKSVSSIEDRLTELFQEAHPRYIQKKRSADILFLILTEDIHSGFIKCVLSMRKTFHLGKSSSHPTFNQRWLFSEYLYQLLVVLIELLDYFTVVVETVLVEGRRGLNCFEKFAC